MNLKFLIALVFVSLSSFSQSQWRALSSAISNPNNQRFDDVFFLDENLGWALNGSYASVYKTTDGGVTWTQQLNETALGANYYFRNIEFLNQNVGFVGTLTNNKFFKTIDGGATWSEITNISPAPRAICGLDAVGTSTVYGCGAYFSTTPFIVKSVDSGTTWQYINMSSYATGLVEIMFIDENFGYVSGRSATGGIVLKTTDGGQSWVEIYNSGIPGEYVWKMQLLQGNSDVIFGSIESVTPNNGKLIRTTNAGVTWETKNAPEVEIQAVGFISLDHGWMGGHSTGFYETNDGGNTWVNLNVGSNLNRIFIINENLAYASGTTVYKYDQTLSSTDFQEVPRVPLLIKVVPNPIVDKLNLSINFKDSDNLNIELYDNLGRKLKDLFFEEITQQGEKLYSFDFPYPKGVYYVNLHSNTGRQSIKIIK